MTNLILSRVSSLVELVDFVV